METDEHCDADYMKQQQKKHGSGLQCSRGPAAHH